MSSEYRVIFCTCPDHETATRLAKSLVSNGLAGCVNLLPQIQSIYSWDNKVESNSEALLVIKTTLEAYPAIETHILALHPYDCPEIITLPIEEGYTGYLDWISQVVKTT